jgi:hypothetical protein
LASLVLLRKQWLPLTVHRKQRDEYIDCLESADKGDLGPLVALFVQIQKSAFLQALSISEQVLGEYAPVKDVISAAVDRLQGRLQATEETRRRALQTGTRLVDQAVQQLQAVAKELSGALVAVDRHYAASVDRSDTTNDQWFKHQIIKIARHFDYYADTRTFRSWVRLKIKEDRQTELVLSFHSVGTTFVGVLGVSAFVEFRDRNEEGESTLDGPYPASSELFEHSYLDDGQTISDRFRTWLQKVIVVALDQWRRQL